MTDFSKPLALERSEERYRALATATAQLVWLTNASGEVTEPMPAWQNYTGQTDAEIFGWGWVRALHPEDATKVVERWTQALRDRSSYRVEYRLRRRDGVYRSFESCGVPVAGPDGQVREWVGACSDITERNEAEEQLSASLKNVSDLKAALDEHAIVATTNPQGKITYVNDKFCSISRYSREELLGQDHRIINSGFHPREFFTALWDTISRGQVWKGEIRNRAKDGGLYWVDTTIVPFLNLSGSPYQYVAIRADITERKRAEEAIQNLNADLERRVVERTLQLEEANRELEAFSYSVSHDLRAPLRHLMGYSQLLASSLGEQLSDGSRHYLETIRSSATRMGALIDNLLAFSRMGRASLSTEPVNMSEAVMEAIADLNEDTQARQIEWQISPLEIVDGDRLLLRQVWVNLIANALKFTRRQPVARIKIDSVRIPGGRVRFSIRDNGVGFDMRYVEKLFGVFQRLHHHDEFEGTGIGLASVRRIIRRHGGTIQAEAIVDAGATFHFEIPEATPDRNRSHDPSQTTLAG